MFIELERAEQRENSEDNLINKLDELKRSEDDLVVRGEQDYKKGGTKPHMSEEKKLLAGVLAHFDTHKNVAEELGISERSVGRAKAGETQEFKRGDGIVNEDRKDKIAEIVEGKKLDIVDRALGKMLESIIGIDTVGMGAKGRSEVARNLSSVIKNVSGNREAGTDNRVQVVVINPGSKKLGDYEVVDV